MKTRIRYIKHEPGHYDIEKNDKVVGSVTQIGQGRWIAYQYGTRYEAINLKHAALYL